MGHMKDLDRRIRQGGDDAVAAACELAGIAKERLRLLSQKCDFPTPDNAANRDNTPAANPTPRVGSEHNVCTLTDAEREAVEWRRKGIIVYSAGTVVATIATAVLSLSLLWFAK